MTETKGMSKVKRELHAQVSTQDSEGLNETEELWDEMDSFISPQIFGGVSCEPGTDRRTGTTALGALTL